MGKIKFKNGIVEDYTIILSTRDYRHQGQITGIKSDTVEHSANLNSANELSFTVCKYDLVEDKNFLSNEEYERYCKEMELLWERIVDFKLIYIKELDEYYEIRVSIEDSAETIKTITATSLCECELSQLILDRLEINSQEDIERVDYDVNFPTVFCRNIDNVDLYSDIWYGEDREKYVVYQMDEDGNYVLNESNEKTIDSEKTHEKRREILKSSSLLHRALKDKAPHYSIEHVDASLMNEIRTFSVSGTSIYDFFTGDVAEQINCIFIFNSKNRSISVYDLYTVCKDCGHREEFFEIDEVSQNTICPKCKSENIYYFGEDTTIYIDKTNLTDSIRLETNADETKNCLKLEAGDDLMTSTVQMLNPNGSNYLIRINKYQRKDMPESLIKKLEEYDGKCAEYAEEHEALVEQFYQLTDDILYLEHGMMPTIKTVDKFEDVGNPKPGVLYVKDGKTYVHNGKEFVLQNDIDAELYANLIPKSDAITAGSEAAKLTTDNLSPLGVNSITKNTKVDTINVQLKNYAKIFVKSGYVKIDITTEDKNKNPLINTFTPEMTTDEDGKEVCTGKGIWKGHFIVTNYSNEDDVVITPEITVTVHDDYEEFLKQKVLKDIALNNDDDDGSIFDVLEINDLTKFTNALTLYGKVRLESFQSAIEGAMEVLIQAEQASEGAVLYEDFYLPYYKKLQACRDELNKRNLELSAKEEELDKVDKRLAEIHEILDFRTYLGEENYKIFCAYRREDTYNNANYISEGSEENSSKLIADAKLFLKVANQELIRVSEPQITITSSLKNFLVIPQFKPLLKYFKLGNWIRIKVDGVLYHRVRLVGYNISFGNLQEIGVQFSSVTKERNVATDAKEIIQSAKSMATSFGFVSKQAEKGSSAKDNINEINKNGLNSALVQIKNNQNEEITYGKHGILCRTLDDLSGDYSPEQLKITHNIMAYTDDNWESVKQAIGKHNYIYYDENKVNDDGTKGGFVPSVGYGMTADFVTAGYITGSQIISGDIYSDNYVFNKRGSHLNLHDGTFDFAGGKLTYKTIDGEEYGLSISGIINAEKGGTIAGFNIDDNSIYKGTNSLSSTTPGIYLGTNGIRQYASSNANVTISNGVLNANGANISGKITADDGTIGGFTISDDALTSDGKIEINSNGRVRVVSDSVYVDDSYQYRYYSMMKIDGGSLELGGSSTDVLQGWGELDEKYPRITVDCWGIQGFEYDSSNSWLYITNTSKSVSIEGLLDVIGNSFVDGTFQVTGSLYTSTFDCEGQADMYRIYSTEYIHAGTNLRFGDDCDLENNRGITTYWNDDDYHFIVQRGSDGLTSYFGWSGTTDDKTYKTNTILRGQSFYLKNTSGATIQSDERLKKDFVNMSKWESFYDSLEPVAFRMKNGASGRYHMGFKAQQVEQALVDNGLTTSDFAGFVKSKYTPDEDDVKNSTIYQEAGINPGDDEYGLIYTEFVAMNTHEIQKLKKEVADLKQLLNDVLVNTLGNKEQINEK